MRSFYRRYKGTRRAITFFITSLPHEPGTQAHRTTSQRETGYPLTANERAQEITPLARFALAPVPGLERAFHLGFAAVDPPEIRRGVRDLATALQRMPRRVTS